MNDFIANANPFDKAQGSRRRCGYKLPEDLSAVNIDDVEKNFVAPIVN
jgi:hypothetical protein